MDESEFSTEAFFLNQERLESWVLLRLKSSASLTSRQSGTDNAAAIEWATFNVGLRWNRSIREIIFGARSAFSAKDSWDKPFAFRWSRTTTPKALAKSFERTHQNCHSTTLLLQEQLFQFTGLRFFDESALSLSNGCTVRASPYIVGQTKRITRNEIMKTIHLAILIAGLCHLTLNSNAQCTPFLTNGLVAYYPMSQATAAQDASGNGNNGTILTPCRHLIALETMEWRTPSTGLIPTFWLTCPIFQLAPRQELLLFGHRRKFPIP